jgi:uncharacterized protein (DUF433 family)
MDEHPLVRFVDGPAGRRTRLAGTGSDVWEVIAAVRDNDGDLPKTADFLELPLGHVQAVVAYYGRLPGRDRRLDPAQRARRCRGARRMARRPGPLRD